jgi:hypothetical protein
VPERLLAAPYQPSRVLSGMSMPPERLAAGPIRIRPALLMAPACDRLEACVLCLECAVGCDPGLVREIPSKRLDGVLGLAPSSIFSRRGLPLAPRPLAWG